MNHWLALGLGVLLAAVGGDLFVKGAVALSKALRVPAGIIGATVAAFATSSPEFAVALTASAKGEPAIALGDSLGSNVVNVALILGIVLLIGPIPARSEGLRRDLPVAIGVPLFTALLLLDGELSRLDAGLFLTAFFVWLGVVVRDAMASRASSSESESEEQTHRFKIAFQVAAGLVALVAAAHFIVLGAKGIGAELGLDPFVVGATMVAVGTSTPELATCVLGRLRGYADVAVGAVLGSNIYNGLWIVAWAALIEPIRVPLPVVLAALAFGLLGVLLCLPFWREELSRRRGWLLVASYAAFVATTLTMRT